MNSLNKVFYRFVTAEANILDFIHSMKAVDVLEKIKIPMVNPPKILNKSDRFLVVRHGFSMFNLHHDIYFNKFPDRPFEWEMHTI